MVVKQSLSDKDIIIRDLWNRDINKVVNTRFPGYVNENLGIIMAHLAFGLRGQRALVKIEPTKIKKQCVSGLTFEKYWSLGSSNNSKQCVRDADVRITFKTAEGKFFSGVFCLDCYYSYLERGFHRMVEYFNIDFRGMNVPFSNQTIFFKFVDRDK